MFSALFALLLALGMIAAGWGYVSLARRMRTFRSTSGVVVARDVVAVPGLDTREAAFGQGGGYTAQVRYRYTVDGVELESDKTSFALRGWKRSVAERRLASIPDQVLVWYDPAKPSEAYLEKHEPGLGYALIAGGAFTALCAVGYLIARLA